MAPTVNGMARSVISHHARTPYMFAMTTRLCSALVLLAACADPTSSREQPDAALASTDAQPASSTGCTDEAFELGGAVSLVTRSASTITVSGKVAGVSGASDSSRLYAMNVRLGSGGDLDEIGTYDVATLHIQYLDQPYGGCSAGTCIGFFAMAGTIEVIARTPMYRATFTLQDLRERADAASSPGAPIAGEVTGCVSAVN
jgi:hypothetical protein